MRNFKVIAVALVLCVSVGCKKKKKDDGGGNMASGSSSMSGGSGSAGGNMAGSGSTMDGSGSAGSDTGAGAGSGSSAATEPPKKDLVNWAAADLKWVPMDPSKPDASPLIVPLWGDMQKEANGFLIKLKGGSPGSHHTHSNDYHGVTITGAPSHLQDGQKKAETLPAPAYWFEPGKAPHTSQCLGKDECIALVHFNEGMADFAPAEFKKDGKVDPKYVEKRAKDLKWAPLDPSNPKGPQVAGVWGDGQSGPNGFFVKIPAGFASPAHTHTHDYHAVVIKGTVMNSKPDDKAPKEMGTGSYFMQPGTIPHITACKAGKDDCLTYVYMTGKVDFQPAGDAAGGGSGDMKGSAAGDMKGSAAGDMKGSAK